MLTRKQISRVRAGLSLGLSQREVARLTGVSRGSVQAIESGRGGLAAADQCEETVVGPLKRCGECGHLVNMPCVYCRALAYLKSKGGAR